MFIPKLIVTDLDGTALRTDKTVSPATAQAFASCQEAGIPVAIATARYIAGARPYANALKPAYQILTDGTLVYQQNTLLYSNAMDVNTTNQLLQELVRCGYAEHVAIPTVYGLFRYPQGGDTPDYQKLAMQDTPDFTAKAFQNTASGNTIGYHFDIYKPFPFPANKVVANLPSEQEGERIASECGCSQFHYRGETLYTFFHPTASKLDAIAHVAQHLGITVEDVLVFGDDINDLEMIRGCGMGVAMGNALPQVRAAADQVIGTNEEDGLAAFLFEQLPDWRKNSSISR